MSRFPTVGPQMAREAELEQLARQAGLPAHVLPSPIRAPAPPAPGSTGWPRVPSDAGWRGAPYTPSASLRKRERGEATARLPPPSEHRFLPFAASAGAALVGETALSAAVSSARAAPDARSLTRAGEANKCVRVRVCGFCSLCML